MQRDIVSSDRWSLIRAMWSITGSGKEAALPGVVAPDSHVEFVFHLASPWRMRRANEKDWRVQPRAFVYAQKQGALRFDGQGPVSVLAYRASPIVAARVLKRSVGELWDLPVSLNDIIGSCADALVDSLYRATPAGREDVLRVWLERRLAAWDSEDWESERLFDQIMWHSATSSIASAAKSLGWSSRSLHRHLRQQTSLSPKEIQLAGRHLQACALLRARRDLDLTEIAGRVGFFDHAAFTHSFHARIGMSPSAFRAESVAFYESRP